MIISCYYAYTADVVTSVLSMNGISYSDKHDSNSSSSDTSYTDIRHIGIGLGLGLVIGINCIFGYGGAKPLLFPQLQAYTLT